jgi:hypothetical protein
MRRLLPAKSLTWWAVIGCTLAAVAVFLAFEVLDLDGSALAQRLFQPPISSQPTLAEAEGVMRHAAFGVPDTGCFHLADVFSRPFLVLWSRLDAIPRLSAQHPTRPLLRPHLHRASFSPPFACDEPPSPVRQTF